MNREQLKKIDHLLTFGDIIAKEENNYVLTDTAVIKLIDEIDRLSQLLEAEVKPAKNVRNYEWLDNKLNDILTRFEHKHITKEGAKDLLYEFIFDDLVNEIQKLKDCPLSV